MGYCVFPLWRWYAKSCLIHITHKATTNPLRHAISKDNAIFLLYIEPCMYFYFQNPLSRTFLRALKTAVHTDLKGRPQRHTRNMTQIQPLSRGANQRSSTDVTVSRMEQDHQVSPYMNTRSSFVSDTPSSLFRPGMTATGPIESRTSLFARKLRYLGNFFFIFFSSHTFLKLQ